MHDRCYTVKYSFFLFPSICYLLCPYSWIYFTLEFPEATTFSFSNPCPIVQWQNRNKLTGLNDLLVIDREGLCLLQMISAEAPVLFAKAAQIFITELTLRAWIHTEDNKRRTLQVILYIYVGKIGQAVAFVCFSCMSLDQRLFFLRPL